MSDTIAFDDGGFSLRTPRWPDLDTGLLEDARSAVPPFPLKLLPPLWANWIADTAQSAGTSADYVAQGLFAAVAAVCGAGVRVRVTPAWTESLVLWLALVGSPSSGKSPALASVRAQLGQIEDRQRADDGDRRRSHAGKVEQARLAMERWQAECKRADKDGYPPPQQPEEAGFDQPFMPSQIVVGDATIEALADVVAANPRGVILWRDELTAWLANLGRYASGGSDRAHWLEAWAAAGVTINRRSRPQPLHLPRFPVSIAGSIQPDRLAEAFQGSDDGMAARFLYAWPELPKYTSLMDRRIARDDEALAMLQAIATVAADPEQPLTLTFEHDALEHFDGFLERLHEQAGRAGANALEEGWLGKGRGTVARLAGLLTLLHWSGQAAAPQPRGVTREAVMAAISLWSGYFRPHAMTVFGQAGRIDRDKHARRAALWLRGAGQRQVSREQLRREALAQTIDAAQTDRVILRLEEAGFLRPVERVPHGRAGRPSKRYDVNPAVWTE